MVQLRGRAAMGERLKDSLMATGIANYFAAAGYEPE